MAFIADYQSYTDARRELKHVLDVAESGRSATVARDGVVSAVVSGEQFRRFLARTVAPQVRVVREEGLVIAIMDGLPLASEGASIDDAVTDLIFALREYAEDWTSRLYLAPNHKDNWGLVQLVRLSTDQELLNWLNGDIDS